MKVELTSLAELQQNEQSSRRSDVSSSWALPEKKKEAEKSIVPGQLGHYQRLESILLQYILKTQLTILTWWNRVEQKL